MKFAWVLGRKVHGLRLKFDRAPVNVKQGRLLLSDLYGAQADVGISEEVFLLAENNARISIGSRA